MPGVSCSVWQLSQSCWDYVVETDTWFLDCVSWLTRPKLFTLLAGVCQSLVLYSSPISAKCPLTPAPAKPFADSFSLIPQGLTASTPTPSTPHLLALISSQHSSPLALKTQCAWDVLGFSPFQPDLSVALPALFTRAEQSASLARLFFCP